MVRTWPVARLFYNWSPRSFSLPIYHTTPQHTRPPQYAYISSIRFRDRTQLISVRQVDWSVMLINYSSLCIRTRLTEWNKQRYVRSESLCCSNVYVCLEGCLFVLVDHLKVHWFPNVRKVGEKEEWAPKQDIHMFALVHKCKQIWVDGSERTARVIFNV